MDPFVEYHVNLDNIQNTINITLGSTHPADRLVQSHGNIQNIINITTRTPHPAQSHPDSIQHNIKITPRTPHPVQSHSDSKKKKHQHQQFHNKPHLTGKHTRICKCAFVENTRTNLPLSTRRYVCLLPYTYVCTNKSVTAAALCGTYSSQRLKESVWRGFWWKDRMSIYWPFHQVEVWRHMKWHEVLI